MFTRLRPRAALFTLCVLWPCGSLRAAIDPEATLPYKVQVVLRVADHRVLTPLFKEQLRRELHDGLRAALGAMGEVEVIDVAKVRAEERPALWNEVEQKGLQQGLDGPVKGPPDVKTHFVTVDYVDGQYEVQARQYDGLTGLASPGVRRSRTHDRQFVARAAALLVDRDFGLVGTVTDGSRPNETKVTFKGGALGVPLDRWLKVGDVFALVQIGGGQRPTRVPWAILQLATLPDKDGTGVCRAYRPGGRPLTPSAGVAGYRCLKLGTTQAPVRLRLMRARAAVPTPAANLPVQVRQHGFATNETTATTLAVGASDADGYFATGKKIYQHIAFITVQLIGGQQAQVAVPIVDDRTIVLPVSYSTDAGSQLVARKRLWEDGLLQELLFLADLFTDLNKSLGKAEPRQQTLDKAKKALKVIGEDLKGFIEERKQLAAGPKPPDLSVGDGRLKEIEKGRDELTAFIDNLEKILAEENDPVRLEAKTKYERARLLEEKEKEFGKAIELYEEVLKVTDDPKLRERLARLKEQWKPKGDAHAEARAFIYERWPKVDVSRMRQGIKEARAALAECQRAGDILGPQRLVVVATAHVGRVSERLKELAPDVNEDDRREAQELTEVLDQMAALIKEVAAYLKQAGGTAP